MLRTQGIASRIVNGFLPGEYNEAAGAFTVRQSDAHSWVEVYFPQTQTWVTFDPTPPAGRTARVRSGLAGALSKYSEALELMWFQYVVGYDKQEQRSLITSLRKQLLDFRRGSSEKFERARMALPVLIKPILLAVASLGALVAVFFLIRRIRRFGWRRGLQVWNIAREDESSRIDFYERLVKLLARRGLTREPHQTPLEFAALVSTEATLVTSAYNRVRFGKRQLTSAEKHRLEGALAELEKGVAK